jgi:hypothetical protein
LNHLADEFIEHDVLRRRGKTSDGGMFRARMIVAVNPTYC